MHPRDCEWWEYKDHPDARAALSARCELILHELENKRVDIPAGLHDTRPFHKQLFLNLTPAAQPYLAGNYRGGKFKCLRHLQVQVKGDPRVGAPPDRVASLIANLSSHILAEGLRALDEAFARPDSELQAAEKLNYAVKFSCRVLVLFLGIHPYANGNGHVGRLMVWFILARYGYWPQQWPLDEHPPYDELLARFRDGEQQPLEDFVLRAIAGMPNTSEPVGSSRSNADSNVTAIKVQ